MGSSESGPSPGLIAISSHMLLGKPLQIDLNAIHKYYDSACLHQQRQKKSPKLGTTQAINDSHLQSFNYMHVHAYPIVKKVNKSMIKHMLKVKT